MDSSKSFKPCKGDDRQIIIDFCKKEKVEDDLFIMKSALKLSHLDGRDCFTFWHDGKMIGIGFVVIYKPMIGGVLNIAFSPNVRGKIAHDLCNEWICYNITHYGKLYSLVNKKDRHIKVFNKWLGFEQLQESDDFYLMGWKGNGQSTTN